jgi:hypothetical protein
MSEAVVTEPKKSRDNGVTKMIRIEVIFSSAFDSEHTSKE